MGKESMGEFLESAVASALRFIYGWQTVVENYHLLRPEPIKKKHEPKVSSIEIDVFGIGRLSDSAKSKILGPQKGDEIILVQCKDEWYESDHKNPIETLQRAKGIVQHYYKEHEIRKVLVTLLPSPRLLRNGTIEKEDLYVICNVAWLQKRIRGLRSGADETQVLLSKYLRDMRIGDLRQDIIEPLLGFVIKHYDQAQNKYSLTNFPSLALQSLRSLFNVTCFSDKDSYPAFISEQFVELARRNLKE
jgi:hypothetical protein